MSNSKPRTYFSGGFLSRRGIPIPGVTLQFVLAFVTGLKNLSISGFLVILRDRRRQRRGFGRRGEDAVLHFSVVPKGNTSQRGYQQDDHVLFHQSPFVSVWDESCQIYQLAKLALVRYTSFTSKEAGLGRPVSRRSSRAHQLVSGFSFSRVARGMAPVLAGCAWDSRKGVPVPTSGRPTCVQPASLALVARSAVSKTVK